MMDSFNPRFLQAFSWLNFVISTFLSSKLVSILNDEIISLTVSCFGDRLFSLTSTWSFFVACEIRSIMCSAKAMPSVVAGSGE